MSDIAITLEGVTKTFRRFRHPGWRAVDALGIKVPRNRFDVFAALRGVDLEVKQGERMALIGRNGAGKSTLLRLVSGQMLPDSGRLQVEGNVQALMELGTGFHPDFTGIENIHAALSLQGSSGASLRAQVDEIIDFTELEGFIERPVREYSAGMYARLAFAVATAIKPEVLIVDEVLGAGDAYFVGKSTQRMKGLTDNGATVLFVSHDMSSVQLLCERAVWIDHGTVRKEGPVLQVSKAYLAAVREDEEIRTRARSLSLTRQQAERAVAALDLRALTSEDRYGSREASITAFDFRDAEGRHRHTLITGEDASAVISCSTQGEVRNPVAVLAIYRPDGTCAMQVVSNREGAGLGAVAGEKRIKVNFAPLRLGPGDYIVSIALFKELNLATRVEPQAYDLHDRCYALKILPPPGVNIEIGVVNQPATWELLT